MDRLRLPEAVQQKCCENAAALAVLMAHDVAALLREALRQKTRASLRVSGGRSPIAFFEALSRETLDWSAVRVGLVDDRWVPADHPDSNARLVREHLLQNLAAAATFVPLVNEADSPEAGLERAREQQSLLGDCDVLVLGMGEDGHTASLFPDAAETPAAMRAALDAGLAAIRPTRAPHPRITLTLSALLSADRLLLPIQGASKRAVLERATLASASELPIAAVLRAAVPLTVYYCD